MGYASDAARRSAALSRGAPRCAPGAPLSATSSLQVFGFKLRPFTPPPKLALRLRSSLVPAPA